MRLSAHNFLTVAGVILIITGGLRWRKRAINTEFAESTAVNVQWQW